MIKPVYFIDKDIDSLNKGIDLNRGCLVNIHIADIHFGALDPEYQYNILKEQFIKPLIDVHLDMITINGDLFDHKFMSNSNVVLYATLFINDIISLARFKNATVVILSGTLDHDDGQLKLFYHYLEDKTIDVRIIETIRFEYIKGAKVLCIPEEYNRGEEYYNKFLLYSGLYDIALVHGMFKGAVYNAEDTGMNSIKAPTFCIDNFVNCLGYIAAGHVHTPGCFNSYFYYSGSPLRWCFGEEHEKGFFIALYNMDTYAHYMYFYPIISMKYETININDMLNYTPEQGIEYINMYKTKNNIDFLRLELTIEPNQEQLANLEIIKKYFKNNTRIKMKFDISQNKKSIEENNKILDKYKDYSYILDNSLSEYEILTRYINQQLQYEYITTDELISLIQEE